MYALFRWALAAGLLAGVLPAQAIVGGINTTDFKNVNSGESNSGVQFTDNWVLTARHLGNSVGGIYSNGYGSATVAAFYDIGAGAWPANDLVLLRLATPISTAPTLQLLSDILPVGSLAQPLDATIATGKNQSPRGYAFTEVVEVLDKIDPDGSGPLTDVAVSWLVSYLPPLGIPYVQGGDSGGGLFLGNVTDSSGSILMGISTAQFDFGASGFGSGFIELAAYRGWIDSTMAGDLADAQLPNWISAVPEPSSWALFAAGGALLLGASARRTRNGASSPG